MPDAPHELLARRALARWENEGGAREAGVAVLPEPALDLTERLGVNPNTAAQRIALTQSGDMRLGKGTRRSRLRASTHRP